MVLLAVLVYVSVLIGLLWAQARPGSRWRALVLSAALVGSIGCHALFGGGTSCVLAGSMVATPSGPRRIETLRLGDPVLGLGSDGKLVVGTVTATRFAWVEKYLAIELASGRLVRVTGTHPISCKGGWVRAERVQPGDRVRTREGFSRVERVQIRRRRVRVYDLQVTPCENFFADGVLVHNKKQHIPHVPAEPEALIGVWIVSDEYFEPRRCRLELRADGTGECAFWRNRGENPAVYRYEVRAWELTNDVEFDRVRVTLKRRWTETEEHLTGRLIRKTLLTLEQCPQDVVEWSHSPLVIQEGAVRAANEVPTASDR